MMHRTSFYRGRAANHRRSEPAAGELPVFAVTHIAGADGSTETVGPRMAWAPRPLFPGLARLARLALRVRQELARLFEDDGLVFGVRSFLAYVETLVWMVPALTALTLVAYALHWEVTPEEFELPLLLRTAQLVTWVVAPVVAYWHFILAYPRHGLTRRCAQLVGTWAAALAVLTVLGRTA